MLFQPRMFSRWPNLPPCLRFPGPAEAKSNGRSEDAGPVDLDPPDHFLPGGNETKNKSREHSLPKPDSLGQNLRLVREKKTFPLASVIRREEAHVGSKGVASHESQTDAPCDTPITSSLKRGFPNGLTRSHYMGTQSPCFPNVGFQWESQRSASSRRSWQALCKGVYCLSLKMPRNPWSIPSTSRPILRGPFPGPFASFSNSTTGQKRETALQLSA